ncbi:MAG: hypothetical protein QOK21_2626 [Solirubrobacteraceae bacterium]|nr:hypothetical protein [Solirubrobacteraceae bacterium]
MEESGRAWIDLAEDPGEIREVVELSELAAVDRVPALDALVLHFDYYGRLARIEVSDSAASVLPPELLDEAAG